MSWTKRNIVPKKIFKIGDMIDCVITEIDNRKKNCHISQTNNRKPISSIYE